MLLDSRYAAIVITVDCYVVAFIAAVMNV